MSSHGVQALVSFPSFSKVRTAFSTPFFHSLAIGKIILSSASQRGFEYFESYSIAKIPLLEQKNSLPRSKFAVRRWICKSLQRRWNLWLIGRTSYRAQSPMSRRDFPLLISCVSTHDGGRLCFDRPRMGTVLIVLIETLFTGKPNPATIAIGIVAESKLGEKSLTRFKTCKWLQNLSMITELTRNLTSAPRIEHARYGVNR